MDHKAAERAVIATALRWYAAVSRPRDPFTELTEASTYAGFIAALHTLYRLEELDGRDT